jgi:hypothetical protein
MWVEVGQDWASLRRRSERQQRQARLHKIFGKKCFRWYLKTFILEAINSWGILGFAFGNGALTLSHKNCHFQSKWQVGLHGAGFSPHRVLTEINFSVQLSSGHL